jgi:uncharacterized protein (DUF983 family)
MSGAAGEHPSTPDDPERAERSGPVSGDAPPVPLAAPTLLRVALEGLCPRCGARTLYDGLTQFAPSCGACGLDFSTFNVGDGPAAFLTLILGALVVIMAISVELTLHPPLWLHMMIWIPVTAAGVVLSLRAAKGALVALEYRNAAREGRVREEDA